MSNDIRFRATLDDKVSSGLGKISDNFDRLGGKGSAASLFGNVGAKAVAAGFNLIASASRDIVGTMGDAINAAIEDEHSQQRLGIALKDNVANFKGNTDAIEKVIKSREALAFSDEDQRQSLATLVTVTHDVNKALQLEAGAMDIARARGVDLATAADAVAKAFGGNTKTLKSLIPGLDTGTNSLQALDNAFKAVAGSSASYADTSAGKVEKAQIRINEAMERAGYTILPVVAEALDNVSFALDSSSIPLERYYKAIKAGGQTALIAQARLNALGKDIELVGKQADDTTLSLVSMNKAIAQTGGGGGGRIAHRAAGGPVSAGQPYIVGERGQELFVPRSDGAIVPNAQSASMSSGGTRIIQLVVSGRVLAEVVDRELYSKLQRAAPTALRT